MLFFDRKTEFVLYTSIGLAITIRDLHMEFDILLHRASKPNQAKITIYNLSQTTRDFFKDNKGVEFKAGYGSTVNTIFKGTTIDVQHKKSGVDWITEITAGDGQAEFLKSYYNKSYAKGTPLILIFTELAASFGLPFVSDFLDASKILKRGATFSGRVSKILDRLCDTYKLSWSIQNQIIEIINLDSPPLKDIANVTVLSTDTGLLDTPQLTENGIIFKSLLNPAIFPSRLVFYSPMLPITPLGLEAIKKKKKLPVPSNTGVYLVDRCRYQGSNFGGIFEIEIESVLI